MSSRVRQSITMPGWLIVCGTLLLVLLLIQTASLRHMGLTTDEPLHYHYGYRVLDGAPRRGGVLDSSTMPFSSLHAMTSGNLAILARGIGIPTRHCVGESGKAWTLRDHCFSLLLALYVLKWSYELYGRNGALLSLSLYVFDPNLLAHGHFVTADLAGRLDDDHGSLPLLAFSQIRRQSTSPFELPNTRLESIGQILVHLPVSDFPGDCCDLLPLSVSN